MSVGRLRRVTALAILVSWLTGPGMPALGALHDLTQSDVRCGDPQLVSHHWTTQFESVLPPHGDGHCDVCHLQRALRAVPADAARIGARDVVAEAAIPVVRDLPHPAPSAAVAPRAPPALPA